MSSNFDNQLDKMFNEDIKIPKSILDKKENAFADIRNIAKKNRTVKRRKIISVVAALCIVGSTFAVQDTFAAIGNKTIAAVKNLFFKDEGAQKAVENGLVQNLWEKNMVKDQGIEIGITDIVYDSSKLALSLNVKFEDKTLLNNLQEVDLDMNLKDNNGRYLLRSDTEKLSKEQEKKVQRLKTGFTTDKIINKETGEVKYNLVLYSMEPISDINSVNLDVKAVRLLTSLDNNLEDSTFSKAESKLEELEIYNYKQRKLRLYNLIEGKWQSSITLDEKLKAGKEITYVPEGTNGETIKIIKAELLPTCMYVTFEFNSNVKDEDKTKIHDKIFEATLVNDSGSNIEKAKSKAYSRFDESGIITQVRGFQITSFDYDGNFKVLLTDLNGENKEITLVKKTNK
ncbi:DUF4179 domain-containing protein [Clostridium tunisiense]|uniref:DUF4179 domain-containing protein n=1 Tax=Clostridium tunisiense TaxID=219748 RepID=UPI0003067BBA|nr:DUF4179 domain-containing protein [Clostridium tunisiense]